MMFIYDLPCVKAAWNKINLIMKKREINRKCSILRFLSKNKVMRIDKKSIASISNHNQCEYFTLGWNK